MDFLSMSTHKNISRGFKKLIGYVEKGFKGGPVVVKKFQEGPVVRGGTKLRLNTLKGKETCLLNIEKNMVLPSKMVKNTNEVLRGWHFLRKGIPNILGVINFWKENRAIIKVLMTKM